MPHTTHKQLESMLQRINTAIVDPDGVFVLDRSYGGNKLCFKTLHGYLDILQCVYVSKSALYELMFAFLKGATFKLKTKEPKCLPTE
jgi:hypothetical protein